MADYRRDETIRGLIPAWLVPPAAAEAFDRYEQLEEQLQDAEDAVDFAEHDLAKVPANRRQAVLEAVRAGEPVPAEDQQQEAERALATAELTRDAVNKVFGEASKDLVKALRSNRSEIVRVAHENIEASVNELRAAVATARAPIEEASRKLSSSYVGVSLLETLDRGDWEWIGGQAPIMRDADFGPLLAQAGRTLENIEHLRIPLDPEKVDVLMKDGSINNVPSAMAAIFVERGGAKVLPHAGK